MSRQVRLTFSGKNALLVQEALALAQDELHNQIATCPDVFQYHAEIVELEDKQDQLRRLLERVDERLKRG